MKDWNADMDVLFALFGIDNMENEFAVAIALAVVAVMAAVCLIVWSRRSGGHVGMDVAAQGESIPDEVTNLSAAKEAKAAVDSRDEVRRERAMDNYSDGGIVVGAIAGALGGVANIYSLGSSDTRLRVTVNEGALVDRKRLKATGALGILAKGRQVQVFYEDQVERICIELGRYIDDHRKNSTEQEAEIDYERVLKKVYVPVEGDVVRVSDIHCLQNLGNGSVGVCAIRATRGEIRAPFDCKAGYSKTGEKQIECTSEEGYVVRIYLISEIDTGWQRALNSVDIRLTCGDGEKVRKGRMLAEYPYETLSGRGENVYAVLEVHSSENADTGHSDGADKGYQLKINRREKVNYEYVACELVI